MTVFHIIFIRISTVHRVLHRWHVGGADRIGISTGLQLLQRCAQCSVERLHIDTVFASAARC